MRRSSRLLALALPAGLLALSASAGAATTSDYGTFAPRAGAAGAWTSTMQLSGTGYPAALLTTSSTAFTVPSGATTYLRPSTPPGAYFGTSQNKPYLNLSPAAAGATSVSTYTFASPVPIGWGFVLGDVDADQVQVTATRADGSAASATDLGFADRFNYAPGGTDLPTWDPATTTLRGSGTDTDGAAGWFRPAVPLKTLTFRFSVITGFPTFQTWFASRSQDVTGHVTATGACDVTTTTVRLLDASGAVLASAHPATDGTYTFAKVAATNAFTVDLVDVSSGCELDGPGNRALDLRTADGVADFAVRQQAPAPAPAPTGTATGTVTDRSGDPVEDAVVVVHDAAGTEVARDETGPAGRFAVPDLPVGALTATVHPPSGYVVVGAATKPLVVPAAGGPVTLDFTLRPRATATTVAAVSPAAAALPEVGGVPAPLPWLGVLLLVVGGGMVSVPRRRH